MKSHPIKESIIEYCLNILKRDDIKHELKELMKPMIDVILQEIYPYIFLKNLKQGFFNLALHSSRIRLQLGTMKLSSVVLYD